MNNDSILRGLKKNSYSIRRMVELLISNVTDSLEWMSFEIFLSWDVFFILLVLFFMIYRADNYLLIIHILRPLEQ